MGILNLRFSDIKWKGSFGRLMEHVATNIARLKFMFDQNVLTEDLRKLLRTPPIGGCSHRKGWGPYVDRDHELAKFGPAMTTDYNVYVHTFPDGRRRVRCNRCGETAWEGDANWNSLYSLMQQSSNRPSSAERVVAVSHDGGRTFVSPNNGEPIFKRNAAPEHLVVYHDNIDLGKEQDTEIEEERIDE